MTRHAYLPTLIITDKGSVFISQVIHEVVEVLGIILKRATTKHAQTIGVLERAHATVKTSSKLASGQIQETIAQMFTHCNSELQHDIPFQY